jgi:hypothetical protein
MKFPKMLQTCRDRAQVKTGSHFPTILKLVASALVTTRVLSVMLVTAQVIAADSSKAQLIEAKACLNIGNINGDGPCTCEGEGGHNYGKAGRRFESKDKTIFILVRFRGLPPGKHKLKARTYERDSTGRFVWQKKHDKSLEFSNKSPAWAFWFPAAAKGPGTWKVEVFLDNLPWFGKDKDIEYGVDSILE